MPTKSYWAGKEWKTNDKVDYRSSRTSTRVVVIGSGMSGVSVAYHLAKESDDHEVIVLDSRKSVSDGATGRNGGVIHAYSWRMLPVMCKSRGIWNAIELIRLERAGREAIRTFASKFGVECDLSLDIDAIELHKDVQSAKHRVGSSILFSVLGSSMLSKLSGVNLLRNKQEIRKNINISETKNTWNAGIVSVASCDTFWAQKFVHAVALQASRCGAKFLFDTHVVEIQENEKDLHVLTRSGQTIECDRVVVATNAWTPSLLPEFKDRIVPVRNHVLATKPLSKRISVSKRPVVFSARGGFVYGFQREDGRIILGGFRDCETDFGVNQDDDNSLNNNVLEEMKTFLLDTFDLFAEDEILEIENVWTGIIGWSFDDTPFVGQVRKNIYVCVGFCGHGMCQTFLCGKAIADMIMDRVPDHYVASFEPNLEKRCVCTADFYAGHTGDDNDG